MKAERIRIALIFIVTAVVVVGGAVYFFAIYRPKQAKKDAQAEIEAWEKRWASARACLLGSGKPQGKTSDALAIHEMSPDAWDEHACNAVFGNISRGPAPNTGLDDVEAAWQELDHAAAQAANGFAMHAPDEGKKDALPNALDKLDDARAALRVAAGLPDDRTATTALPMAAMVPIKLGPAAVALADDHRQLASSVHGVVANGRVDDTPVRIQLAANGVVTVGAIPGDVSAARSFSDLSWGAVAVGDGLAIGTFSDKGEIAGGADQTLKNPANVIAAIGTGTKGTIVLATAAGGPGFALGHWADGKLTVDKPTLLDGLVTFAGDPGRDQLATWWTDAKGGVHGEIVTPDGAGKVADLPTPHSSQAATRDGEDPIAVGPSCFTADRAWTTSYHRLISIAADGSIASPCPAGGYCPAELGADATIVACTADTVVVADNTRRSAFALCTASGCRAANLPPNPWFQAITAVDGKLVSVFSHAGVIAVQREGGATTYFRTFGSPHMQTAVNDGQTLSVLASQGGGGDIVVHVPLK